MTVDELNAMFEKSDSSLILSDATINRSTAQFGHEVTVETREKISHTLKSAWENKHR